MLCTRARKPHQLSHAIVSAAGCVGVRAGVLQAGWEESSVVISLTLARRTTWRSGKYKHSRLLLSHKQRRLKAYDVQLPMFRLYLDNPETTPEAECRTVVGVVVEDAAQQEEILLTSSKLTDLCAQCSAPCHLCRFPLARAS